MPGVKGSLIGLSINGQFIACETSCEFSVDNEMLPASSVTSGKWKEYIAGARGWTMSVNGNLLLEAVGADAKTVLNAIESGLPLFLQWRTRASVETAFILSGTGIPQSLGISAPNTGKATWNASFQGTGALATSFEDYGLLIDAMPAIADYPIIVEEDPQE